MDKVKVLGVCLLIGMGTAVAEDTTRFVTVDGRGTVSVAPDSARLSMAVQARNIDLSAARERVVAVSRKFLELCERIGIDDADIQASGLTMRPEYRWNPDTQEQVLQGYLVRRQLEIDLEDLEQLGAVIEGAVDAGVNEVSPPALFSTREPDLRREALAAASRDALANAEAIAASLGVSVGPVVEVNAAQGGVPRPMRFEMAEMAMAADGAAAETYSVGNIRVEASVTATFELRAD